MRNSPDTILLIADISGYTKFMKQHTISVSHAKQIIVRLLKRLIQTVKPPLKVAELEGDAVFLYARTNGKDIAEVASGVKGQVVELFKAFRSEMHEINSLKTCACDACEHIHDLQLKQVLHAGNVEVERIEQFEKLFGIDVILVHRLLKNSVPVHEYVMMTSAMYDTLKDFFGLAPERFREVFEGVGEVETVVFYPKHLPQDMHAVPVAEGEASVLEKIAWRSRITYKTLLDTAGLLKFKGKFDGLPT
jgi:hypothetical protein